MSLVSMIMHSSIEYLLAGSKVNSRSSGARRSAAGTMEKCLRGRDCSAFDYRLQFHRHLNIGEKNVSLQARSSSEIVHIGLACPSFGGDIDISMPQFGVNAGILRTIFRIPSSFQFDRPVRLKRRHCIPLKLSTWHQRHDSVGIMTPSLDKFPSDDKDDRRRLRLWKLQSVEQRRLLL